MSFLILFLYFYFKKIKIFNLNLMCLYLNKIDFIYLFKYKHIKMNLLVSGAKKSDYIPYNLRQYKYIFTEWEPLIIITDVPENVTRKEIKEIELGYEYFLYRVHSQKETKFFLEKINEEIIKKKDLDIKNLKSIKFNDFIKLYNDYNSVRFNIDYITEYDIKVIEKEYNNWLNQFIDNFISTDEIIKNKIIEKDLKISERIKYGDEQKLKKEEIWKKIKSMKIINNGKYWENEECNGIYQ